MPANNSLTLYIPDLFGLQYVFSQIPKNEIPALPLLEKWLSRGQWIEQAKETHVLFSEFAISPEINPPLAALCLLAEDQKSLAEHNTESHFNSYWLRADPICIQPDRDTAIVVAHEEIGLTTLEASTLVNEINSHFSDEPWQLYAIKPDRWYLRIESYKDLQTHSLNRVLGQDISVYSTQGKDANYWDKCINEIQMLLHGSSINFERESRGLITANSLWIWGEGTLEQSENNNILHDQIVSNNILYSGVAKYYGIDHSPLDDDLMQKIQQGNSFLVIDNLTEYVCRRDLFSYIDFLKEIEEKYLGKIESLLKQGIIHEVFLLTESGLKIKVTSKLLKRWWKRTKSFQDIKNQEIKHVKNDK